MSIAQLQMQSLISQLELKDLLSKCYRCDLKLNTSFFLYRIEVDIEKYKLLG